jgi:hypothetical protein
MDYRRAVVVDAEVNKEQRRPLFGVNGEVRSKVFDRLIRADIVRDAWGLIKAPSPKETWIPHARSA